MEQHTLTVDQLYKEYTGEVNYKVLKGIDFQLKKNEFVAVMGPSGSGKTTFLNCISTIDRPTSGSIIINDKNPYNLNDEQLAKFRRNELGFIFQDFNLVHTLTVEENILLPLTLDEVDQTAMSRSLEEILQFLEITDIRQKRTFEISGGQKQRVAIARAVIHQPNLLLADEPTGNLDSKSANSVMQLFQSIQDHFETSLLMVTHDPYVASFAERVIFIQDGILYNEIHRSEKKQQFYQEIMDTLTFLGGGKHEF
ncbi:ABC transporter ATP-binding protein [Tetragenococcus koreensis]|uniref:Antimicrobial peptide ABC transporter ATP-binding protein n=1 Tax=Tetragenococcus koreensis TaxID=290335 RepID=A0AAN4RJW2_9ENTE|nr:ABC transporter ATP-binding protein [Tetragenococcus koreensis]MDN6408921.1 ABC transporter ATP-binding protein [Tetragenococcus halophilus]MCF1626333.1 ABC transporter ATP-binding protein [Tetragenococcus koreensis]MCF1630892.1 ABC transporter ATP-binding protein [Tetragenococcus koreensis]MDN6664877.1 ABC transporter ATP-binding protein [Tetragenococcus koreensis]GEQ48770.1 antimicrobial peptide ABC transporter ATP-binding protein [Tetragenococcus koreensis]